MIKRLSTIINMLCAEHLLSIGKSANWACIRQAAPTGASPVKSLGTSALWSLSRRPP